MTYPLHTEKVVTHHPIKKNKCPYCNLFSKEGFPLINGENFSDDESGLISITNDKKIEVTVEDDKGYAWSIASIKIKYCPFCRREL